MGYEDLVWSLSVEMLPVLQSLLLLYLVLDFLRSLLFADR